MNESALNYLSYKSHGICVQCGQWNAAPNRVRCEVCLLQNAESARKHRKPKDNRNYAKQLRQKRKEAGLCIWCGKPQSKNSTVFCIDCKIKNQRNNDQRKDSIARNERPLYGLCYRCGNEAVDGKKLCQKCADASVRSLKVGLLSENRMRLMEYRHKQNKVIFGGGKA